MPDPRAATLVLASRWACLLPVKLQDVPVGVSGQQTRSEWQFVIRQRYQPPSRGHATQADSLNPRKTESFQAVSGPPLGLYCFLHK